jgi:uncharacterized repeat protein (TIGR02543 family)
MKKTVVLALAAAACLGLLLACPDPDPDPSPGPGPGPGPGDTEYTVKFYKNDGTEETGPYAEKKQKGAIGVANMPESPTRDQTGWNAGMVFGTWNTKADGTGTTFTGNTVPTADMEVYAKWKFQNGGLEVVGETLVHNAPTVSSNSGDGGVQGTWNGEENYDDGSIYYVTGAVRYMFPEPEEIEDYDQFTVTYIYKGTNMQVITKKGTAGQGFDYMPRTGDQYPTLSASVGVRTLGPFAIKVAGDNRGLGLQRNTGGPGTIKITKVTFAKVQRRTINFDASDTGYTAETIPSMQAAQGIMIGPMPVPDDRQGYTFVGWLNALTNASVGENTNMPSSDLNLKAKWQVNQVAEDITVDFRTPTVITVVAGGGTAAALADGTGYTFTYGSGQYEGAWSKFTVTLDNGISLADYDEISFTAEAVAGDTNYKDFIVLAGKPLPSSGALSSPTNTSNQYNRTTVDYIRFSTGTQELTFTINKTKAASLTGDIEFSIYGHCGAEDTEGTNGNTPGTTEFIFSDFKIIQY